ncbi:unnamed protein product [Bursaphelenchus xylophilus]|uniref:(pine wood nematode) hypothetical protein n=1 Tax=Bursaphelenchus xylophilus TaxID=6326 RepID=A0A1I7SLX1_BURXY|nr:unnamed protein product [Bursaphelenchus xylophilus]CAG9129898.1 unnamed protein product [Bursaphelenchus xylophilus]
MVSRSKFWANGVWFNSVEHYYQFTKVKELLSEKLAKSMKAEKVDPAEMRRRTKAFLKTHGIQQCKVDEWKDRRAPAVLFDAIQAKFDQNERLRRKLLETGTKVLINTFSGDRVFTSGSSPDDFNRWVSEQNAVIQMPENLQCFRSRDFPIIHKGHNVLGFLLMELRQIYLKAMTSVPPPSFQVPTNSFAPSFQPPAGPSYFVPQSPPMSFSYCRGLSGSYSYGQVPSVLNSQAFSQPPPAPSSFNRSYYSRPTNLNYNR